MTPAIFVSLTRDLQTALLSDEGQFLLTRDEPGFTVDMYRLHQFFVEVYYHKHDEGLVAMRAFADSEKAEAQTPVYDLRYLYKQAPFRLGA